MGEFVLYGGKGGVGKTTCAAATGLALAGPDRRVLVVSTDPAHSLGDVFETRLGPEPTAIEADLYGVEPGPEAGQETYRRVASALAAELRSAGIRLDEDDVEGLFAAGLVPGSDELAALRFFGEYAGAEEFDRVVFDTAPTGHTLRLLSLPDVLAESLSTAAKVRHEVRSLVDSARSLVFGPAAYLARGDEEDDLAALEAGMERVSAAIRDPDRTDFRVVLTPERLAVEETRRLVSELRSLDVPVGTLVVNRVLEDPDEGCDRCRTRAARHRENVETIRETVPDLSVRVLPELGPEVSGRAALERLAARLEV